MTRGRLVAEILETSWQETPSAPAMSAESLSSVTPLLLRSGCGALGWQRIRRSPLADGAHELHQAYRLNALRARIHEEQVASAFKILHDVSIDPVLVKGWAVARLYPHPGLRPYGDIDLLLPSGTIGVAQSALERAAFKGAADLHDGGGWLDDRPYKEIAARSQVVPLLGASVRLAGPEDHLRYLCLHALGHGAWRPLWLCDIGVSLAALTESFDWERALFGDVRRTEWMLQALALARHLLGVDLTASPERVGATRCPDWLPRAALREWGRPQIPHGTRVPLSQVRRFWEWPAALLTRWPNPIEATVSVRGAFNQHPRLPFQIAATVTRIKGYATRNAGG